MENYLKAFFLFYFRVGVIFWIPLTGPMSRIPVGVRFILVNVLVFSLFLLQKNDIMASVSLDNQPYIALLIKEFIAGLIFTLVLALPAAVLLFFGRAVDMQVGLGAAGIFNPTSKSQESLTGSLFTLAALTLFWSLGLHLDVLEILLKSIKVLPLGQSFSLSLPMFMEYFSAAFFLGLVLFFPVVTSLFIVDICAGIVSKSMPQMNVYFVIMPLKILVCFIIMAIVLKQLSAHFESLILMPVKFLVGL